jgi:hypothetical protein
VASIQVAASPVSSPTGLRQRSGCGEATNPRLASIETAVARQPPGTRAVTAPSETNTKGESVGRTSSAAGPGSGGTALTAAQLVAARLTTIPTMILRTLRVPRRGRIALGLDARQRQMAPPAEALGGC